jgi:hypothetical protein
MGEVLADGIVRGVRAVIRDAVETLDKRALTRFASLTVLSHFAGDGTGPGYAPTVIIPRVYDSFTVGR